jgi:hypothetical protein
MYNVYLFCTEKTKANSEHISTEEPKRRDDQINTHSVARSQQAQSEVMSKATVLHAVSSTDRMEASTSSETARPNANHYIPFSAVTAVTNLGISADANVSAAEDHSENSSAATLQFDNSSAAFTQLENEFNATTGRAKNTPESTELIEHTSSITRQSEYSGDSIGDKNDSLILFSSAKASALTGLAADFPDIVSTHANHTDNVNVTANILDKSSDPESPSLSALTQDGVSHPASSGQQVDLELYPDRHTSTTSSDLRENERSKPVDDEPYAHSTGSAIENDWKGNATSQQIHLRAGGHLSTMKISRNEATRKPFSCSSYSRTDYSKFTYVKERYRGVEN